MKFLSVLFALISSSSAFATICDVDMAKKFIGGLELVASGVSDGAILTGDKVNGKTITKADIKAVSADSAYIVTVTNQEESDTTYGNYSKYLITLKQAGNVCFPASIIFVGNSRNSGK